MRIGTSRSAFAVGACALFACAPGCFFTLAPLETRDAPDAATDVEVVDAPTPDVGPPPCEGGLTDALNCGACGHSCLGGACADGRCQPIVLAPSQPGPICLARDAANLYWGTTSRDTSADQQLRTMSIAGGMVRSIAFETGNIADCAIDDVSIFYVTLSSIRAYPKAGAVDLFYAVRNTPFLGGLATDRAAGKLYWYGTSDVAAYGVYSAPIMPDAPATLLGPTDARPYGLDIDATRVLFTSKVDRTLSSVLKTGGAVVPLVADAGVAPAGIAVSGGRIFWADQGGAIFELVDGARKLVASDEPGPEALAVDESRVYWVNPTSGTVRSAPKDGGAAAVLASGRKTPWRISVDGAAIYWVENDAYGAVVKLAK